MNKWRAEGSYASAGMGAVTGTGSAAATYTVTDGDGDTATAPIAFTIVDANVPTAGATQASVDDDALAGGNPASMTGDLPDPDSDGDNDRSEEHTSELQSLMRISYAVFCLKKKKQNTNNR